MNIEEIIFLSYKDIILSFVMLFAWVFGFLYCCSKIRKYQYMGLGILACLGMSFIILEKIIMQLPTTISLILPYSEKIRISQIYVTNFFQWRGQYYQNEIIFIILQIALIAAIAGRIKQSPITAATTTLKTISSSNRRQVIISTQPINTANSNNIIPSERPQDNITSHTEDDTLVANKNAVLNQEDESVYAPSGTKIVANQAKIEQSRDDEKEKSYQALLKGFKHSEAKYIGDVSQKKKPAKVQTNSAEITLEEYEHQYRVLKEYDRIESQILSPLDESTIDPKYMLPKQAFEDITTINPIEEKTEAAQNLQAAQEHLQEVEKIPYEGLFDDSKKVSFHYVSQDLTPVPSKERSPLEDNTVKPNLFVTDSTTFPKIKKGDDIPTEKISRKTISEPKEIPLSVSNEIPTSNKFPVLDKTPSSLIPKSASTINKIKPLTQPKIPEKKVEVSPNKTRSVQEFPSGILEVSQIEQAKPKDLSDSTEVLKPNVQKEKIETANDYLSKLEKEFLSEEDNKKESHDE